VGVNLYRIEEVDCYMIKGTNGGVSLQERPDVSVKRFPARNVSSRTQAELPRGVLSYRIDTKNSVDTCMLESAERRWISTGCTLGRGAFLHDKHGS